MRGTKVVIVSQEYFHYNPQTACGKLATQVVASLPVSLNRCCVLRAHLQGFPDALP